MAGGSDLTADQFVRQFPVNPPRVVAVAEDEKAAAGGFCVGDRSLPWPSPTYGDDTMYGTGRRAPNGEDVGDTEAELKPKMLKLLDFFAHRERTGMARRLFDKFLAKQNDLTFFEDPDLNAAADRHPHIVAFCMDALGAPWLFPPSPGTTRIHQALKAANWDVSKVRPVTGLEVKPFNRGSYLDYSEDWSNGLHLMINGVQHAYVIATHYYHDAQAGTYFIRLRHVFYDVFGLDDDDVDKYGAKEDNWRAIPAQVGITAWWQLQHQHSYAPVITRIVLEKTYAGSAM
jgi:hypothetical protein